MNVINQLRARIDYNPETGEMFWKQREPSSFTTGSKMTKERQAAVFNAAHAGKPALGCVDNGYLCGTFDGKRMMAHRAAWMIYHGVEPSSIDHIDGNRRNNRIDNLREASPRENARNRRLSASNKSGVPGVYKARKRWAAQINSRGERIYLGSYATKEEAISARQAAEKVHGYHPNHGN